MGDRNEDKDKKPPKKDAKAGPSVKEDEDDDQELPKRTELEKPKKVGGKESTVRIVEAKLEVAPSREESTKPRRDEEPEDINNFKPLTHENSSRSQAKSSEASTLKGPRTDTRVNEAQSDNRSLISDSERTLRPVSLPRRLHRLDRSVSELDQTQPRRQSLVTAQIEENVLTRLSRPNLVKSSGTESPSACTLSGDMNELISGLSFSDSSFKVYPGTEQSEYDFSSERGSLYTTNLVESIAHMVKGILGVGVLSIHEAWMRGGMWASLGAMVVIGFLAPYTMRMLVKSAQKLYVRMRVPKLSYPDLAEASMAGAPAKSLRKCGKPFRYLVDITVVTMQCVSCSLYQLATANTLKKIVETISSDAKEANISVGIYVLIISAPLVGLCLIKKFRYLSLISIAADIVIALCILTAIFYSIKAGGDLFERPAWKNPKGFFNFCGVCLYSVDGITLALPIENNMRYPKLFPFVLQVAMSISVLGVAFVGFFGYWGWGEKCVTPITLHIQENIVTTTMGCLLISMLLVTFAIQFWVPFRILWRYVGKRCKKKESVFRLIMLVLITILSVSFPHMNTIMAILGDVIVSAVAFIYPPLIEIMVTWREYRRSRWSLVKNLSIIFCGMSLISGGLITHI